MGLIFAYSHLCEACTSRYTYRLVQVSRARWVSMFFNGLSMSHHPASVFCINTENKTRSAVVHVVITLSKMLRSVGQSWIVMTYSNEIMVMNWFSW